MRHFLLFCLAVFLSVQMYSQILINEISSSNLSGIQDEDGDLSDWIEFYNNSTLEINLDGYHLSDNPLFLSKWSFPAVVLKPETYLLVFASGKNRSELPLSYQTIIAKGDNWNYLVPSSDIGNSWQNTGFDASSWNTGNSGFGYGDDDDGTVLNNIVSVFIRKEFTITNLADVQDLILSIDYDDGFVAWINGKEIARSNLGTAGSAVEFNQLTGSFTREASMYLNGLPETFIVSNPENILVEGLNVIAIQGHNTAETSSDLSLIPMLTLGLSGGGYIDNYPEYIKVTGKQLHSNFKIKSEGESIVFSRPDSSFVDSVQSVFLLSDITYGRKADGENSWFYFISPTPGNANTSQGYQGISGDTVKFSYKGGYFPGGLEVQLSSNNSSDTIIYTLNGSEPTINSLIYSDPIMVSKNTVIRARALNFQKLSGIITTNTYFTTQHTLPVVCLSTDSVNLWDYNTGIYVLGPNASTENPFFGANFWEDWERKGHMELYDVDGNKQIDQDIGIKISGAWSRANPQKSLALFARAEYGKGSFGYKVFKDKPINKFESLILRNGGNDFYGAIFRDGLTSTLVRGMDMDRMAFQPAIIYINGEYWGIQNIREKVNSNFLAENHFVNPDSVNLLEMDGTIVEGSNIDYLGIKTYLNTHTLESEADYMQVTDKIDINNYIQYQLTQIFVNNKDWPGNNIKYWNTNDPGSLWRWIIYDTDFGLSFWDNPAAGINTLSFALDPAGPGWPNPPWSTFLFRRMVSNPGFRNEFANQYADRLNTNFASVRSLAVLDSMKQVYLPEINDHVIRWNLNYGTWLDNLASIKSFLTARPANARNHIQTVFDLGTKTNVIVKINTPGTGKVKLNSIIPENYPFTGVYFQGLPIKLTAIPSPGYKFLRWEGNVNSTSLTVDYNMSATGTFTAVFDLAAVEDIKVIINEINYNSSTENDTKDWIELLNAGNGTVNLKNWVISDDGTETGFTFASDFILSPGSYAVVCRELAAYSLFHQNILNVTGDMGFGLSSTGDDINLFDSEGILADWVNYAPNAPWPTTANGTGSSIELIDPLSDNNNGSNWKSSSDGGTPGAINRESIVLDVKHEILTPGFTLDCFPNPFSDYTSLRITTPVPGMYKIEVYDLQGRLLNILANQNIDTGAYYIDWDGRDQNNEILPDGVYIFRLSGENQSLNLKVVKLK